MTDNITNDETLVIADEVYVTGTPISELSPEQQLSFNDVVSAIDMLSVKTERQLSLIFRAILGQNKDPKLNEKPEKERRKTVIEAANKALLRDEAKQETVKKNNAKSSEHKTKIYQHVKNTDNSVKANKVDTANQAISINKLSGLSSSGKDTLSPLEVAKEAVSRSASNQVSAPSSKNDGNQAQPQTAITEETKQAGAIAQAAQNIEKQTAKQADYYKDFTGRVRHSSGRYASKEEVAAMKVKGHKSPLSGFASVVKNPLLGKAVFGGAYQAVEEIAELKASITNAFASRGIHNKETAKQYGKQQLNTAKQKVNSVKDKAVGIRDKLRVSKNQPPVVVKDNDSSRLLNEFKKSEASNEQRHIAEQIKTDEVIDQLGDIPAGGGGGAGASSLIEDALDLFGGKKRRRRRKGNKRSRSRFGGIDLPDNDSRKTKTSSAKAPKGRFGRFAASAGRGAAKIGSVAGGAALLGGGSVALGGAGALAGRALPWVAAAMAVHDAYSGFTDKTKQEEVFNLQRGQEATLAQKSSLALGSVLDMGGLVSGGAGLVGSGLEAIGISGAKNALTFDEGDIAKKVHKRFASIEDAIGGIASGDFSRAAGGIGSFITQISPLEHLANAYTGIFGSDKDEAKAKPVETQKQVAQAEKIHAVPANQLVKTLSPAPVNTPTAPLVLSDAAKERASSTASNVIVNTNNDDVVSVLHDIKKALNNPVIQKQTSTTTNTIQTVDKRVMPRIEIPKEFSDPYLAGMANDQD